MGKLSKLQRSRGIYLLPNFFTTTGLFAAFYAIVVAMKGEYDTAAIAIFVAMISDAIDGRVARFTKTQTAFGAEYDSLCDMVSFGVAPALVAFSWSLSALGKMGWLVAFMYTAAAGLRLARFNTQVGVADKRYFQGLSSPSAAGIIASFVWLCHQNGISGESIRGVVVFLTFFAGVLMVSNIRYYSFKEFDFKGKVPFVAVLLVVLIFVGVALNPPLMLFLSFSAYALSGPVYTLVRLHRTKRGRKKKKNK